MPPGAAIADDLALDAVRVEEIEAAAGIVVAVREGREAGGQHPRLGRVEIVDLDADMVERVALGEVVVAGPPRGGGVERDVVRRPIPTWIVRPPAIARALPAHAPAEQACMQRRRRDRGRGP